MVFIFGLGFGAKAGAATYYVSQSATNDYQIGVDTNSTAQAQNKATPWLTIGKANATVTAGDIVIVNDGTYHTADGGSGATYLTMTQPYELRAETTGAVTVTSTNATYVVYINPGATGTWTFTGLIIDAEGRAARTMSVNATAFIPTLVLDHTTLKEATNLGLHFSEPDAVLTITDSSCIMSAMTATGYCINMSSHASGAISIDGFAMTVTSSATGIKTGIDITDTNEGGTTVSMSNVTGSITATSTTSGAVWGVKIMNVPNASVTDSTGLTITSSSTTAGVYAVQIATSGGIQSDGAQILRNTVTCNAVTSYCLIIGLSTSGAEDNKCNNGVIANNTVTGMDVGQANTPHGIAIGPNTGGNVYGNTVINFAPAILAAKTDSTTKIYNNIIKKPYYRVLYAKGATGTVFSNNIVIDEPGYVGIPFFAVEHSAGVYSTDVLYENNIAYSTANSTVFVSTDANNTASFVNNLYYSSGTAATNPWAYQSTSYANWAAWTAAHGTAELNTDPLFLSSSDYNLLRTSPAIDAGTDASLTSDYSSNSIYGTPDIGAYEYQPPHTFTANNIPTTGSVRLYSDGKYRMTTASTTSNVGSFSVTPYGGLYYTASTSQYMDITIDSWLTTGTKNKQWTATSTAGNFLTKATSTIYTIGDLAASTYYQFKLDSAASTTAITGTTCTNGTCLSDSSGNLTFAYQGGYSTHTFALEKDVTAPSAFTPSSPANNSSDSNRQPTLSWNASSDSESGLSKYQLYIDGAFDTNNISNSSTSITPTNALSCSSHTWFIRAVDNAGNTADSNTYNLTRICSGSSVMPTEWYIPPKPPADGLKIIVNQNASTTTNRIINLNFNAGFDVKKMAISLTGDFSDANQEDYHANKQLDICSKFGGSIKNPNCSDGQYIIYVKFYTQYGVASNVISQKITLSTAPQLLKPAATFTKDLRLGLKDSQVKILQQFLNQNGFKLANSGVGSIGYETDYFGQLTSTALAKFQEVNKGKVAGLSNEKGYLGSITREFINSTTNATTPATPIQQVQNVPSVIFTYSLYKGMQSEDVRRLQKLLATKPEIYPEGLVTGYFGPLTKKAVQKFQLKYNVVNSKSDAGFGVVGPKTRAELKEVFKNM